MSDLISVTVDDGKYTIQQTEPGKWEALRYGEPWPAYAGSGPNNLEVALAYEVDKLRRQVASMSQPEGSFIWALQQMLWEQKKAVRKSVPGLHYQFDGAEGCRFWMYIKEEDTFEPHAFTVKDIIATDWKVF